MTVLDGETQTTLDEPQISRRRRLALTAVGKTARLAVKARDWRVHVALPGVAGAGLVSAALAMRFGIWAGLLAAGLFCLRLDSRIGG